MSLFLDKITILLILQEMVRVFFDAMIQRFSNPRNTKNIPIFGKKYSKIVVEDKINSDKDGSLIYTYTNCYVTSVSIKPMDSTFRFKSECVHLNKSTRRIYLDNIGKGIEYNYFFTEIIELVD